MNVIYDNTLIQNTLLILLFILIILLIHIAICVYIYISQKKHPEANGLLWFIINLLFPPIGLIGYLINKHFSKNTAKNN